VIAVVDPRQAESIELDENLQYAQYKKPPRKRKKAIMQTLSKSIDRNLGVTKETTGGRSFARTTE